MRIVYYNRALVNRTGPGVRAHGLLDALVAQGHDMIVMPSQTDVAALSAGDAVAEGRPRYVLHLRREMTRRALAKSLGPVLLQQASHFHPDVVVARRMDYDYTLDWLLTHLKGVPYVADVNAVASIERPLLRGQSTLPWEERRERSYLRGAARLGVAAADITEELIQFGVDTARAEIVHNAADIEMFAPDALPTGDVAAFAQRHDLTVAYVATSSPVHDMATLMNAAAKAARERPGVGFVFVGPEPRQILTMAVAAGISPDDVLTPGSVAHDELPGWLAASDVCWGALARKTHYALKIFEYMAMGKPVVMASSGVGDSPVTMAGAGFVVPAGDSVALADALVRVLDLSPGERAALGASARRWTLESATWDSMATRLVQGVLDR